MGDPQARWRVSNGPSENDMDENWGSPKWWVRHSSGGYPIKILWLFPYIVPYTH